MVKKSGLYFGTEVDGKWWKRYIGEGFFVRGNGDYWFDEEGFYFQRYLTKTPLLIPFEKVSELGVGNWHSGRWNYGLPIVKIQWNRRGTLLSSGFRVSFNRTETDLIITELEANLSNSS
jgi:hypothetical protein